ncbi:AAA family ATPase [Lactococcus sp. AK05]|uniref:AAA family ATPase n=1 Tax=Lactococcus sp. AK05 TaxID=3239197 RepID=UPI0034DF4C63
MINTINLSNYSFVFSKSELSDLKRKNFIYGKNGTGKSSLVKAIREQYSDTYDIRVFDGWRGIIKENNYLDAIALGEINVDKQIEIDEIDEKIKEIDKEISEPQAGIENLFKKQNKIKSSYDLQNRKIETFYTSSASKISTKLSLGRSYDKRNFKIDIPLANILSERDINRLRETIKADKIIINPKISFPKIDLDKYLVATNGILQTVVLPSGIINELTNNIEKQNFAKLGMKIHNRDIDNEPCSFCGSVISKDRWVQLDRYFSDEVEKLDRRVADGLNNIENCLKSINDISIIDEKQYYPEYKELIQELNFEILEIKSSYNKSLNILKNALEEKKGKTIIKVDQVNVEISQTLSDFQLKYDDLYEKNMMYAENLEQKQKIANEMIRYHEVKISLDNFDYTGEKAILVKLESNNQLLSNDISSLKGEKNSLLQEKRKLIADMTKELSTVSRINEFLRGLGSRSFSLDYIDTPDGQKGQYRLLDTNGAERSVQIYLQVTPHSKKYPSKSRNPEQRYIKFLKTENRTSMLTISCDSENIKTIYDELWEELKYAYEQNKVTFMWNNMRRILETYNRFNFKNNSPSEIENEFEDSVDKVLIIALIKSLNVNSHVGYETDIDISGKTRDELKDIFSYIFEKLNASQHFTCYWAD